MVAKGIRRAEAADILAVDRSPKRHAYQLVQRKGKQFSKIPTDHLKAILPELPTRGITALNALKIYCTLVSVRVNGTPLAKITHARIVERTSIQPRHVRSALDVLYSHNLVHLSPTESIGTGHPSNVYFLRGLSGVDIKKRTDA
jgi:DNA-binding transcriptional ArsR family regulator